MEIGLTFTSSLTVGEENTALAMGDGDLKVLATPVMVALMENAVMKAVAPALEEGSTTVGSMINTSHLRPSGLGEKVEATARLVKIEGRELVFLLLSSDCKGVMGEWEHVRYIVDVQRFLSKLG